MRRIRGPPIEKGDQVKDRLLWTDEEQQLAERSTRRYDEELDAEIARRHRDELTWREIVEATREDEE